MRAQKKSLARMTAAELRTATGGYDRELPVGPAGLPGRALNRRERRQWNRARKKLGRPRVGKGVKRVMISMEKELLQTADRFAKKRGLTRAGLIAQSVKEYIDRAG
jgi:hypothetical protein